MTKESNYLTVENTSVHTKYKLAIIVDTCLAGGVSKALVDFIKCIDRPDFDITLFVRDFDSTKCFPVSEDVLTKCWPNKQATSNKDRLNKLHILINKRDFARRTVYEARLYKDIDEEFDCVIGYQMISNDVSVMSLEKINAKRRILWLHGKKKFAKKNLSFFDKLYSKSDAIVAVSKETEERFKKLMPRCAGITKTIHNFYDFELIKKKANEHIAEIKKSENEIVIVSTGRLSKEKGFDRVPDVTKKLINHGYNIQWYVAGDGEMMETIRKKISELDLDDNVHMIGFIKNPYPYVKRCDIYVQPSYTEGFCTSTMEAKILRKPVVTTNVPGMKEQFSNEYDGLIVESSIEGIYRGIKRLIEDKTLLTKIKDNLNSETFSNKEEVQKAIRVIKG